VHKSILKFMKSCSHISRKDCIVYVVNVSSVLLVLLMNI